MFNSREQGTFQLAYRKLEEYSSSLAGRKVLPKGTSPPQVPKQKEKESPKFFQLEEPGLQTGPGYC